MDETQVNPAATDDVTTEEVVATPEEFVHVYEDLCEEIVVEAEAPASDEVV